MRMGYYVSSIRPPTVEKNTSRLRISLSALHSLKDVLGLTQALNSLMNSHAI
jgi:8-amino-7-oxononanoate synthase